MDVLVLGAAMLNKCVSGQDCRMEILAMHPRQFDAKQSPARFRSEAQNGAIGQLLHSADEGTMLVLPTGAGKTVVYHMLHLATSGPSSASHAAATD